MAQEIYLPDETLSGQMIEDAWQAFCKRGKESGYDLNDDTFDGFAKDCFAAGYCFGHNDTLEIIRDQLNVNYEINKILNKDV